MCLVYQFLTQSTHKLTKKMHLISDLQNEESSLSRLHSIAGDWLQWQGILKGKNTRAAVDSQWLPGPSTANTDCTGSRCKNTISNTPSIWLYLERSGRDKAVKCCSQKAREQLSDLSKHKVLLSSVVDAVMASVLPIKTPVNRCLGQRNWKKSCQVECLRVLSCDGGFWRWLGLIPTSFVVSLKHWSRHI